MIVHIYGGICEMRRAHYKEQNPFHFMVQINISSLKLSLVPCNIKWHDIMYTVRYKK